MAGSKTTVNDRVWQQLRRKIPGIARVKVKVGVVGSEADKTHGDTDLTNADIAIIQELGAPEAGIPARSFVRKTFEDQLDELKGMQAKVCKLLLSDKIELERAMNVLGAWAASAIKATITQGRTGGPPLKPATIRRKGSSLPLVDTGQLVNSISWAVYL